MKTSGTLPLAVEHAHAVEGAAQACPAPARPV